MKPKITFHYLAQGLHELTGSGSFVGIYTNNIVKHAEMQGVILFNPQERERIIQLTEGSSDDKLLAKEIVLNKIRDYVKKEAKIRRESDEQV